MREPSSVVSPSSVVTFRIDGGRSTHATGLYTRRVSSRARVLLGPTRAPARNAALFLFGRLDEFILAFRHVVLVGVLLLLAALGGAACRLQGGWDGQGNDAQRAKFLPLA